MISRSADYKQVNVRCREDHKAQNMVEFDEEVTAAAIVITSQIGFVHKQTGRKATYLKSSVGKQNITPYFGLGLKLSSLAISTVAFCHGSG